MMRSTRTAQLQLWPATPSHLERLQKHALLLLGFLVYAEIILEGLLKHFLKAAMASLGWLATILLLGAENALHTWQGSLAWRQARVVQSLFWLHVGAVRLRKSILLRQSVLALVVALATLLYIENSVTPGITASPQGMRDTERAAVHKEQATGVQASRMNGFPETLDIRLGLPQTTITSDPDPVPAAAPVVASVPVVAAAPPRPAPVVAPVQARPVSAPIVANASQQQLINMLTASALAYGQNVNTALAVARCESSINNAARGAAGEIGFMQFMPPTFYANAKRAGTSAPDIYNPQQQANVAMYMWSMGQARQWTCWWKVTGGS